MWQKAGDWIAETVTAFWGRSEFRNLNQIPGMRLWTFDFTAPAMTSRPSANVVFAYSPRSTWNALSFDESRRGVEARR